MEHPCYKCGAHVEDGTPFCARCNAPQIRVAGPAPLAPAGTAPEVAIEQYVSHAPPVTSTFEWPQALPSTGIALLAAIVIIVISESTGLGMFAGGFLSVVLYRRRRFAGQLTVGMGARLGALTGVLGFGVVAVTLALWTTFRSSKAIHDALLNYIQQYAAHSADPRMPQVLELFNTPAGFTFIMILTLIMTLAAFLVFSSLGGALGAFLLYRKGRL